ncbi:MAG: phospho-N-acetylmuramoyl-pentapeptide-transferase [Firmicutes bacterium]|nr:phospho-N-acetylmuramoyl-pentapeptide-transferase [Bacillota bacterium]
MPVHYTPLFGALIAFTVSLLAGPRTIAYLSRLKLGQQVREDGPKTHLGKAGTPTMGGILIILAIVIGVVVFPPISDHNVVMLFATVGFAALGFFDDFIKVVAKRSLGLRAREKLVGQFGIAVLVALYAWLRVGTDLLVPFSRAILVLPPWLYVPFTVLVLVGTVNAVNLTDGLDGLAAGSTAIAATAFGLISWILGYPDLALFAGTLVGACLGFSWFNAPPAQVFMGDTGSLGLGAALGTIAVLSKTSLFLPIIGGLFVIETLSVIIQVLYFKFTKGQRLFRMAPLHHHFELLGWAESKVMIRFWLISVIFAILGLFAIL